MDVTGPAGARQMSGELTIEASGLVRSYRDVRVLAGVDLRVPRGSIFALLGPNGAGKTTTVRILATLSPADAGRATVAGYDIVRERHLLRRSISLTGQCAAVDGMQTGEENLRMMARLSGQRRAAARRRATRPGQRAGAEGSRPGEETRPVGPGPPAPRPPPPPRRPRQLLEQFG